MMMGYWGLMAPLARVTAPMKTRAQNWPETDAANPGLGPPVRDTGDGAARNKCNMFARNFAAIVSLGKANDLLAGHIGFELASVNLHRRD